MAKIRSGFVSNSSSSSFICDISGEEVSGMDLGLSEAGMYECEGGHTFLEGYLKKDPQEVSREEFLELIQDPMYDYQKEALEKVSKMSDEDWEDEKYDIIGDTFEIRYNLPSVLCPICSMDELCVSDHIQFLIKKTGITRDEVFKHVKAQNKRRRKFYDHEYIQYAYDHRQDLTEKEIIKEIKERFKNYEEFHSYING